MNPAIYMYSLMPSPHPKKEERGLMNLDRFLGLAGSVGDLIGALKFLSLAQGWCPNSPDSFSLLEDWGLGTSLSYL